MTSKVYRTAQGKTVDLGTIMLQNEHVRAVGNMNVNARGDKLDHNNRVIETKPRQIQKQNARTTNVSAAPVQSSANANRNKQARKEKTQAKEPHVVQLPPSPPPPVVEEAPVAVVAPPVQQVVTPGKVLEGGLAATIARQREAKQQAEKPRQQPQQEGGLAAAIARQKEVKQELEKSRRQQAQAKGVRKI